MDVKQQAGQILAVLNGGGYAQPVERPTEPDAPRLDGLKPEAVAAAQAEHSKALEQYEQKLESYETYLMTKSGLLSAQEQRDLLAAIRRWKAQQ